MNLQAKEQDGDIALYLHVPFCATTCDFCAFYQKKPHGDDFSRYLDGVEREMTLTPTPAGRDISSVFCGGGTPSLLGPREWDRLGSLVQDYCRGTPGEWTVELAPAFVTRRRLVVLKEIGVNRISIGVQSFQEPLLEALGRQHTVRQVRRAYDLVRAEGFENVNLDLMFALPGQDFQSWKADLNEAVGMAPEHLSTYCLTFEEDTALYVRMLQGGIQADDDQETLFYEYGWDFLEDHGYPQYEISNFARPGRHCRHHLNTWRMGEWIGIGPSAASQCAGKRYANLPSLDSWHEGVCAGVPRRQEEVQLSKGMLAADALVFGLRLNAGVDLESWRKQFDIPLKGSPLDLCIQNWHSHGLLVHSLPDPRLVLSRKGRLLADQIGVQILESMEKMTSDIPSSASVPGTVHTRRLATS